MQNEADRSHGTSGDEKKSTYTRGCQCPRIRATNFAQKKARDSPTSDRWIRKVASNAANSHVSVVINTTAPLLPRKIRFLTI